MHRRDFLLFRTEQRLRIAEISCERLYMQYVDAQATARSAAEPLDDDPWSGEPPANLEVPTAQQLFADLDHDLEHVDVVRVGGRDWLAADAFRREFELLMSSVRARGGRVEYL
jgi:hypothetical protein